MAAATTGGGGKPPVATRSEYAQFASYVAQQTGLEYPVVAAWILAEGGPVDNPLNIGPGRSYGNWQGAANATVRLLRSKTYAPIIRAGSQGDASTQLNAIIQSPWDAGHYAGGDGSAPAGTLLRGTFSRVQSGGGDIFGSIGGAVAGAAGAAAGVAGAVYDAGNQSLLDVLGINPGSWVADAVKYIEAKSVTGLAYVALTGGALALIVLGLSRSTGVSLPGVAAGLATRRGGGGDIPF